MNDGKELHGAGVMIISAKTNNILFLLRSELESAPNLWAFPGGMVDDGETIEDAIRREIWEEIGYNLDETPITEIYVNSTNAPKFTYHTYVAIVENEFEPRLNFEHTAFIWSDVRNAPVPRHLGVDIVLNNRTALLKATKFLNKHKEG